MRAAQDERILNERRRHRDKPFDIQPVPSAHLAHLSRVRFEHEYMPALVAPDVIEANERSYEQKLAAHNVRSVRFVDVPTEQHHDAYPAQALQQLVRNAYLHRSYENTHAPVRVYWFADRIEISNPGGPYGSVTVDNFGQPGLADYRNPNLAESMRALGWVQRFGAGIVIARKLLGERLSFAVQATVVIAKIRLEVT